MSGNNPNLKELLARLQKSAGLTPPTPAEADEAMAGPEEAHIDDQLLLDIADAVVRGKPVEIPKPDPAPWSEEELTHSDCKDFAMNRNRNREGLGEETKARVDEAERKALSDDEEADDKDAVEGDGDSN